ncbi:MAG: DUF1622 domain-containing protein [Anaerolineae bacterium]
MIDLLQTQDTLQAILSYVIIIVEVFGALVVIVGVIRAVVDWLHHVVLDYDTHEITALRVKLGKSMVMALEFQVAADILKTGLSPTWQDILRLVAIIAVRTVLNYLLERELEALDPSHPIAPGRPYRDNERAELAEE